MNKLYGAFMAAAVIGSAHAMNQQPKTMVFGSKKQVQQQSVKKPISRALVVHKDAKKQETSTPFAGTQRIIMKYIGVKDSVPMAMQKPQFSRL